MPQCVLRARRQSACDTGRPSHCRGSIRCAAPTRCGAWWQTLTMPWSTWRRAPYYWFVFGIASHAGSRATVQQGSMMGPHKLRPPRNRVHGTGNRVQGTWRIPVLKLNVGGFVHCMCVAGLRRPGAYSGCPAPPHILDARETTNNGTAIRRCLLGIPPTLHSF